MGGAVAPLVVWAQLQRALELGLRGNELVLWLLLVLMEAVSVSWGVCVAARLIGRYSLTTQWKCLSRLAGWAEVLASSASGATLSRLSLQVLARSGMGPELCRPPHVRARGVG